MNDLRGTRRGAVGVPAGGDMQLNSPDNATHARGLLLDHSAEQQKTEKTEQAEKRRQSMQRRADRSRQIRAEIELVRMVT